MIRTDAERVRTFAQELGFDACAIARADLPLTSEYERYRAFLEDGKHASMQYLADHAEVRQRVDGETMLAGAKSVVCVARRYDRPDDASDPELAKHIARYARGRDYHSVVRRKLRQLAAFLRRMGTAEHPVRARPLCDDAPILERAWAARAGLGFVGKNGLLIIPGQGSMLLLGEVLTSLELAPGNPMAEKCGTCVRCLEACPTDAFERPFVLDPRKCVSYWTIEHRGPIPEAMREGIGTHLFGCDDCQTVCPWNAGVHRPLAATEPFAPHDRWSTLQLPDLLDPERFAEFAAASPVKRAMPAGLARNAAVVMANLLHQASGAAETRTQYRASLESAKTHHPEPDVREIAAWAIERAK
jgi:epoxyqueuosine reductase